MLLVWGVVSALPPARVWAGPPGSNPGGGPVPGLFVGSDSRGYPYYRGFRYYPGYPLYRAYPDYNGYPYYPGLSYAAGYQPAHPFLLECLGFRPALWAFPDYYSGNFPSYYAGTPDFRGGEAVPQAPPPGALWGPVGPEGPRLDGPPQHQGQSPSSLPGTRAWVSVQVPARAEVWFDGKKMTANGSVRRFRTPPLMLGNRYTYDVSARWEENGRPVTQSQSVFVTAGADVDVVFPPQPVVAGVK